MLKKLKKLNEELIKSNPWWDYRLDNYTLPNGKSGEYHYVDSRGSTKIIPVTDQSNFLMLRQYRYLNERESIEFPGGGNKAGFTPRENANIELLEETGYSSLKLTELGEYNPFIGVTNEMCHVFLADKLVFKGAKPDDTEQFELLELTESEVLSRIANGNIWDGMSLAAWCLYYFKKAK